MRISVLARGAVLGLVVLVMAVGCQANVVTVENVGGPTAVPTRIASVTAVPGTPPAPTSVTVATASAGTPPPASPVNATTAAQSSPTDRGFVASDLIFGSPTPAMPKSASSTGVTPTSAGFVASDLIFGTPTLAQPSSGTQTATSAAPQATATAIVTATKAVSAAGGVSAGSTFATTGNPANGQALFTGVAGCVACHDTAQGITIVGPSLKGVGDRAAKRIPGMSATDYIHNHIINPDIFTVPGFSPGIMPKTFKQMLTPSQIDDIVAYLMTLK